MTIVRVAGEPVDVNDGQIGKLDYRIGNRRWGERSFISGVERPLESRKILVRTPHQVIPGLAPSAAYASGDALGVRFVIDVPTQGTIVTAHLTDMAKQDALVTLVLFDNTFTSGTDNAAFDMTDADAPYYIGKIDISSYADFNDNSVASARGAWDYVAPEGRLWVQAVVYGTPTLAAATDIGVSLVIEDHSA